ncbi:UDP-N-acetylglucosamine 1-carboxyvinyltransferase, partial [bacterium]|nr:UDP-N-acetylglucosamine 1-carboxyvinyltransferase [candidate division CSSED10-310 bacterium]
MDEIVIKGGKRLSGMIEISGAKNSALPILAASIMIPGEIFLQNVPGVRDVRIMSRLLEQLGLNVTKNSNNLTINARQIISNEAPYDLVRTMRASVLLLGPLLARLRKARVSLPGGCAIGNRPIDIHLKCLEKMGAEVVLDRGMVDVSADQLQGTSLVLDFPTVTGTENIMMAA